MADPNIQIVPDQEPEAETDREPGQPRQTQIPGTERPSNPDLDKLALKYLAKRIKRTELQDEEKKLKVQMAEKLVEMNVPTYKFMDGELERVVRRSSKETIQVAIVDDDE